MSFMAHYFPPAGGSAGREDKPTWFPLSLLLEEMSRCTHARCEQPTVYVWASRDGMYTTACDEHVCNLAHAIDGHEACPKCLYRWCVQPAEETIPRLQQAIETIRHATVPTATP